MTTQLTQNGQTLPRTTLFFTEGASDKIYQAGVIAQADGYAVAFEYGRRDGALKSGTKTESPVSLEQAIKIYEKLVREKTNKGYTTCVTGETYHALQRAGSDVYFAPQLPNPIKPEDLAGCLASPDWFAQQKFDGERRLLIKDNDVIYGLNKMGKEAALPANIVREVKDLSFQSFTLDAEIIGERLYVFDALALKSQQAGFALGNPGEVTFENRLEALDVFFNALTTQQNATPHAENARPSLVRADTARTPQEKRALIDYVERNKLEGVVLKHRHALYAPGYGSTRPDQEPSNTAHLKFKFEESATLEVIAHNSGKRSVAVCAYDWEKNDLSEFGMDAARSARVELGSVTIPPNHEMPQVGSFVEVKYLYANKGGALTQPVYLGERPDQDRADCSVSKLKYKGSQEDAQAINDGLDRHDEPEDDSEETRSPNAVRARPKP